MKTKVTAFRALLSIAGIFPVFTFSQEGRYTIKGSIDPSYVGKIYLVDEVNHKYVPIDSTDVSQGTYVFKGPHVTYPRMAFIMSNANYERRSCPIFLEDGNIYVKTKQPHYLYTSEQGGTLNNAIFHAYRQDLNYATKDSVVNAARIEYFLNPNPTKEEAEAQFKRRNNEASARTKAINDTYYNTYKEQYFGLMMLRNILGTRMTAEELTHELKTLESRFKGHPYLTDLIAMRDAKTVTVGAKAPDFTSIDMKGKEIHLSDYKGHYVLLDFWASWCGPCRTEIPHLQAAHKKFGDRLTILSVSLDDKKKAWTDAVHALNMPWIHDCDLKAWGSNAALKYSVNSIPKTFLIDPEGYIIASDLRGKELEKKLAEVLK